MNCHFLGTWIKFNLDIQGPPNRLHTDTAVEETARVIQVTGNRFRGQVVQMDITGAHYNREQITVLLPT